MVDDDPIVRTMASTVTSLIKFQYYLFVLSKKIFLGSKYPKIYFILFWKKHHWWRWRWGWSWWSAIGCSSYARPGQRSQTNCNSTRFSRGRVCQDSQRVMPFRSPIERHTVRTIRIGFLSSWIARIWILCHNWHISSAQKHHVRQRF